MESFSPAHNDPQATSIPLSQELVSSQQPGSDEAVNGPSETPPGPSSSRSTTVHHERPLRICSKDHLLIAANEPKDRLQRVNFIPHEGSHRVLLPKCFRRLICARPTHGGSNKAYMILGIFPKGRVGPEEIYMPLTNQKKWLFWQMWWYIVRLRGFSGLLSLKDVARFEIYRCEIDKAAWEKELRRKAPKFGRSRSASDLESQEQDEEQQELHTFHSPVPLSRSDNQRLQQFFFAYHSWRSPNGWAPSWPGWVSASFCQNKHDPMNIFEGNELCLKVILDWSTKRIIAYASVPVFISFGVGLQVQKGNVDVDLERLEATWSLGSYMVTAGALLIALLGYVTNASM